MAIESIQGLKAFSVQLEPTSTSSKTVDLKERLMQLTGTNGQPGMGTDEVTNMLVAMQERSAELSVLTAFVKKGLNVVTELTK